MTYQGLISDQLSELCLKDAGREYSRQMTDASSAALSFEDRLELMLNEELSKRRLRRIERRINEAKLKIRANPEEIDKKSSRGLASGALIPAP